MAAALTLKSSSCSRDMSRARPEPRNPVENFLISTGGASATFLPWIMSSKCARSIKGTPRSRASVNLRTPGSLPTSKKSVWPLTAVRTTPPKSSIKRVA